MRILDHNTSRVYLPDKTGYPDPHPELNSVTFETDTGSVHTVHYHKEQNLADPRKVVDAFYRGELSTDPPPEVEPARTDDENAGDEY